MICATLQLVAQKRLNHILSISLGSKNLILLRQLQPDQWRVERLSIYEPALRHGFSRDGIAQHIF